ncbi:unnamed protein product [Adineta steineri]|uniref:Phosphatidate cytidylyltransferase n=1 Tax=Adineta steineri TaxID=433720 RepID=A0A815J0F3_9BILA|nr:unnamed protein product [Adineta steineri]
MSSSTIADTSNLHQRNVERDINTNATRLSNSENKKAAAAAATTIGAPTTDDDMEPLPSQPSGAHMLNEPGSLQNYMQYLEGSLVRFDPRWRNWIIRGIFSFIMIALFGKLVAMGPLVVSVVILLIQVKCFQEIINIGYVVYKSHNLPWFRTLSCHQMIQNICEGMIWFLFPVSLIICNDIMAYVFGFFYGRTPLTKLSPKKTWEGFIGGGISTLIVGFVLAGIFSHYQFFVCPLEYDEELEGISTSCIPLPLFQKTTYLMPRPFSFLKRTLELYPFQLHSLILSLFASSIGPFGGFFASGFKRAFRIKDFAATIPGHGGFVDRFDCQIIMALFTNVYISTFARVASPNKLLQQVLALTPENRDEFLRLLRNYIKE